MCQFGLHQRENEVVDVLKSIHQIETLKEVRNFKAPHSPTSTSFFTLSLSQLLMK
jgi:hypothetical protein